MEFFYRLHDKRLVKKNKQYNPKNNIKVKIP